MPIDVAPANAPRGLRAGDIPKRLRGDRQLARWWRADPCGLRRPYRRFVLGAALVLDKQPDPAPTADDPWAGRRVILADALHDLLDTTGFPSTSRAAGRTWMRAHLGL